MLNPTNEWPSTKAAMGTKFFAQAMRAFLDRESFEGFRAYSLDTIGRLREAENLIEDILSGRVREAALSPLLAELKWSIANDDAANEIAPEYCDLLSRLCTEKQRKSEILNCCQILEGKLRSRYREALIERVIRSINDDKRIEILASTGFLSSHLIIEGHNRDYLVSEIDERFFSKKIKKVGASVVRAFIRSVTDLKKNWVVVRRVNPTLTTLLRNQPDWTIKRVKELPDFSKNAILSWSGHTEGASFGLKGFSAADPFQATVVSEHELSKIKSLRLLSADEMDVSWSADSFVYTSRSNTGYDLLSSHTPLITGASRQRKSPLSGHRLRQARNLADRLYRHFDERSKERIQRALATGAVAVDTTEEEIRLTSLWAAVEVLAGDPSEGKSRIQHFTDILVPSISIRYHRRLFVSIHDQCVVILKRNFKRLVGEVETDIKSNDHTRFAKLVILKENQEILERLLSISSDNPYLCHRIWRLKKLYGSPEACRKSIFGHSERVSWQINRIYRVRNSLVHAGKSPEYTDTLVSNCLEYLRGAVMTLIRVSARDDSSNDLDLLFAETAFEFENMLRKLDGMRKNSFSEKLVHDLFSAL